MGNFDMKLSKGEASADLDLRGVRLSHSIEVHMLPIGSVNTDIEYVKSGHSLEINRTGS